MKNASLHITGTIGNQHDTDVDPVLFPLGKDLPRKNRQGRKKAVTRKQPLDLQMESLVDTVAVLDAELLPLQDKRDHAYKKLVKLMAIHGRQEVTGETGQAALVTPEPRLRTEYNILELAKLVTKKEFLQCVKPIRKYMERYLTPLQIDSISTKVDGRVSDKRAIEVSWLP